MLWRGSKATNALRLMKGFAVKAADRRLQHLCKATWAMWHNHISVLCAAAAQACAQSKRAATAVALEVR